MALDNEEKLRNFEREAMDDAQRECDEIRLSTRQEFQEKLEAGEKQILTDIYDFMQSSIYKIRKEKSLDISHESIKYRREYLQYSDSMFAGIFEKVRERLDKFLISDEYFEYLKISCINVIGRSNSRDGGKAEIDVLYKPGDKAAVEKLKLHLRDMSIKNDGIDTEKINFIPDSGIKIGGFRFRDRKRNILINDILDEKIERSKEMITESIGLVFREANQN